MMKLVETLRGKGTVIAAGGAKPVSYVINIYQTQIPVGNGQTIPGLKENRGRITPGVFGVTSERLTLQLNDGRTLAFFVSDMQGNIQGTGGINPAIAA
jgi:hypothetical protein